MKKKKSSKTFEMKLIKQDKKTNTSTLSPEFETICLLCCAFHQLEIN